MADFEMLGTDELGDLLQKETLNMRAEIFSSAPSPSVQAWRTAVESRNEACSPLRGGAIETPQRQSGSLRADDVTTNTANADAQTHHLQTSLNESQTILMNAMHQQMMMLTNCVRDLQSGMREMQARMERTPTETDTNDATGSKPSLETGSGAESEAAATKDCIQSRVEATLEPEAQTARFASTNTPTIATHTGRELTQQLQLEREINKEGTATPQALLSAFSSMFMSPMTLDDNTDLQTWIDHMDVYASEKQVSGERLKNLMNYTLQGKYRAWWRAGIRPLNTWIDIRKNLLTTFKKPKLDHERLAEIAVLSQEKCEPPSQFVAKVAHQFKKLSCKIDEAQQVQSIVEKLQETCRIALCTREPKTIHQLYAAIEQLPRWIRFPAEPTPQQWNGKQAQERPQNNANLKQQTWPINDVRDSSADLNPQQPRRNRGWVKTATCFNCNKKGHLARDCDQPPRPNPKAMGTTTDVELMVLDIAVGGKTFTSFVDPGSSSSNLSRRWLKILAPQAQLDRYDGEPSQLANGSAYIMPLGSVMLDITVHKRHFTVLFKVFEELATDCILGLDFLRQSQMVIDHSNMEGYFKTNPAFHFPLARQPTSHRRERSNPLWRVAANQDSEPFNVMTDEQFAELNQLLDQQANLFPGKPGRTSVTKHKIEFVAPPKPYAGRCYQSSPAIRKEIDRMINELLADDRIEPSRSSWGAPFFLKKKKNGNGYRPVLDYRELNKQVAADKYPMPRTDDIFHFLSGMRYVSILDGESGFHQIPLDPESQDCTTFVCHRGSFKWKVMPFGLKNASAEFQRTMHIVLDGLVNVICIVYIDDVIIASPTWEDHLSALRKVFKAFRRHGLTLKRNKCHFCLPVMSILGHTISASGIHMNGENSAALRRFPTPTTKRKLQQFLGLANFFRRFIRDFAETANPLNELLKKDALFRWKDSHQKAFEALKHKLLNSELLQLPDFDEPFVIESDASDVGLGAMLSQHINGHQKIIEFFSRSLRDRETRYTTFEKEAMAAIESVERWKHYVEGSHFILITDNEALKWVLSNKKTSGKTARWALRLQTFDYTVVHRPGAQNIVADILSRNPQPLWSIRAQPRTDLASKQQLAEAQRKDRNIHRIKNILLDPTAAQNKETKSFTNHILTHYAIKDDLVYYLDPATRSRGRQFDNYRLYVPATLRHTFLHDQHDRAEAGHLGVQKTLARLRMIAHWPKIFADTKNYVRSCPACQLAKVAQTKRKGLMVPVIPEHPFQYVGVDFVGPLPTTQQGNRYILTILEYFTKWVWLIPTRFCTARTAASKYLQHVVREHGAAEHLISDNGSAFVATLFKEMLRLTGTKHHRTTTYHPQSNATERANRTMKACIRAFVSENHTAWGPLLPSLEHAIRTTPHVSTGETPFFLMFGRDPRTQLQALCLPSQSSSMTPQQYAEEHHKTLERAHDLARAHLSEAARSTKMNYDKHRRDFVFLPNQLVKIKTHPHSNAANRVMSKLAPVYEGPYRVLSQQGPLTYRLRSVKDPTKTRTQNVVDIEPYYDQYTMDRYGEDRRPAATDLPVSAAEDSDCNDDDEPPETAPAESPCSNSSQSSSDESEPHEQPPARPRRKIQPPARYRLLYLTATQLNELPFDGLPAIDWQSVINV